jgi:predicted nucleotidyltransferase
MNIISFDLSGKIDQPTVSALTLLKREADALCIPFFVVGASARDILLKHCYGINPPRATRDVDLGVRVADWESYNRLTDALIATGKFNATRERQRFCFETVLIDIVPFGAITDERKRISWPPEHEIFMSMFAFEESYECAITVRLSSSPELDIRLPILPGLALMKIVSWEERYPDRAKDAEDLLLIMNSYEAAGNFERLYGQEQGLLKAEGFDTRLAGIRLLGRDMAKMADHETTEVVRRILCSETDRISQYRLVVDMIHETSRFDETFDETRLQVEKLKEGFLEIILDNHPA